MKIVSGFFFCATLATLSASTLVYEGFDYANGALGTAAGGLGWHTAADGPNQAGWGSFPRGLGVGVSAGVGGSANSATVQASTLTPPPNYPFVPSGREITSSTAFSSAWREFSPANRIPVNTPTTRYFSFLFSMDNITAGANESYLVMALVDTNRGDDLRVGVLQGSTHAGIGIGNTEVAQAAPVVAGTSYLLVGKLETSADPMGDTIRISVFDSNTLIPLSETWQASHSLTMPFDIDRLGILWGGPLGTDPSVFHTPHVGEIRFGESWGAVAIPEPSFYAALFGLTSLLYVLIRRRRACA